MYNPCFVFCCETWLHEGINDNLISVSGYKILRRDRKHKRGGGLCTFYQNSLKVIQVELDFVDQNFEYVCFVCENVIYILIYLPPGLAINYIHDTFDSIIGNVDKIQSRFQSSNICILGDFNRAPIFNICSSLSLRNIVKCTTRLNARLDHCLFSIKLAPIFSSEVRAPLCNSDHNTIYVYAHKNRANTKQRFHELRDLRKSNMIKFQEVIEKIDWRPFYQSHNVDSKCKFLEEAISSAVSVIPKYSVKITSKDKQWITPLCKLLIERRWLAFRKKNFILYHHYKLKVKTEISKAKQIWYNKCKRSKTGLWNLVKNAAPKTSSDISNLKNPDESIFNLSNRINDHLLSNYTNPVTLSSLVSLNTVADEKICCAELDVFEALSTLKPHKATGSDNISNIFLKASSLKISKPVTHLFNCIFKSCIYPEQWKCADIIPLPKTSPPNIEKLRPISLLPNLSKIFESVLLASIKPYFINYISPNQYGFMPKSSTTTCLIYMHNTITEFLDMRCTKAVTVISFDLRKAFDTVSHNLLLQKLSNFIPFNILLLLANYLSNRSQQTKIHNIRSKRHFIPSGVPQGAILSPMLFNAFINDLQLSSDGFALYKMPMMPFSLFVTHQKMLLLISM